MRHLTGVEHNKVHEITNRLAMISSPVLRLQAILQFSQIVDILMLGDTCKKQLLQNCNDEDESCSQSSE